MCSVLLFPETLRAQLTSQRKARAQVDELMKRERDSIVEYQAEKGDRNAQPPIPAGGIFVWLDRACYGNSPKGFYYVRFHSLSTWKSTAYDFPALIVQKSKLRPDQILFMERKCRETEEDASKARNCLGRHL